MPAMASWDTASIGITGSLSVASITTTTPYDDASYYDYPDYPVANPAPVLVGGAGCYRVLTADGPRVVCQHRAYRHYHRVHRRHHHRRHHHA